MISYVSWEQSWDLDNIFELFNRGPDSRSSRFTLKYRLVGRQELEYDKRGSASRPKVHGDGEGRSIHYRRPFVRLNHEMELRKMSTSKLLPSTTISHTDHFTLSPILIVPLPHKTTIVTRALTLAIGLSYLGSFVFVVFDLLWFFALIFQLWADRSGVRISTGRSANLVQIPIFLNIHFSFPLSFTISTWTTRLKQTFSSNEHRFLHDSKIKRVCSWHHTWRSPSNSVFLMRASAVEQTRSWIHHIIALHRAKENVYKIRSIVKPIMVSREQC